MNAFWESSDKPHLVDEAYFRELKPNRKQVIENYLSRLNGFEQETASYLAKSFQNSDRPLAGTVALIPIAAHQEEHAIAGAVEQYAKQQARAPFSVLLFPNAPDEADKQLINNTMRQIEIAQHEHPETDIRTVEPEMYVEPRIGTIRRDLWNATLLLAHYEGAFDNPESEVIGLNHDIDVIRMSPRYIDRVQRRIEGVQRGYNQIKAPSTITRPFSTYVKHAHDPSLPNAAKATFWYDFTYAQQRPYGSYDAGLVLPMSYYASRGGIKSRAVDGEMTPLTNQSIRMIPGTILETSPRRFASRLQTHGFDEIWGEGSFGHTEAYRESGGGRDITSTQLAEIVNSSIEGSIDKFFFTPTNQYNTLDTMTLITTSKEQLTTDLAMKLGRKKRLAVEVLTRVMELPHIAQFVEDTYDTQSIAEQIIETREPFASLVLESLKV